MGANTYRLMSGFAAGDPPAGQEELAADEEESVDELTRASKGRVLCVARGSAWVGQLHARWR